MHAFACHLSGGTVRLPEKLDAAVRLGLVMASSCGEEAAPSDCSANRVRFLHAVGRHHHEPS